MSENQTTIERAAIRQADQVYSLPRPARHHNVMRHMIEAGFTPPITGEQGFVTSDNRFVDRKAAWLIADQAGQITRLPGGVEGLLFSENLW